MTYYFLEYRQADDAATITLAADAGMTPAAWKTGSRLVSAPSTPVVFRIQPGDEGALPPFVNDSIPLMSNALIDALRGAGVDNIETFAAVIEEIGTGTTHRGFHALNILGLVDCIDEDTAEDSPSPIEGRRTFDLPLFRPSTDPGRIAVHQRVRERMSHHPLGAALDFRTPRVAFAPRGARVGA